MTAEKPLPRILIGVPCYRDVTAEVLEDWMRFAYHLGRRMPQYDFILGIKTKSEQFRARNAIVDGMQQAACDYLLMIDDDMVINWDITQGPTEDYSFLEKLLAHDKDICGVLYYQRSGSCEPVLMKAVGENGYRFLRDDEIEGGLQRVDVAGGGCLLIKSKVFAKLAFPYFEPEFRYGTDIQLCRQALAKGFEVWADTSIELGHLKTERVVVSSRNRAQFQVTETLPGELKRTFVSSDVYDSLLRDAGEWTGYHTIEEMTVHAQDWMAKAARRHGLDPKRADQDVSAADANWYREYPKERVARQVWFNTLNDQKKQFTQFILTSIDHKKRQRILDFGCGIGIPAFALAEKGHDVTAMDIRGTGTLNFLDYRTKKHGVKMHIVETPGGAPVLFDTYDVIVAMDCLEHIADWRLALDTLALHLVPGGVLFCNNGILDDTRHPEHYPLENKEFLKRCLDADLMPFNSITFVKKMSVVEPAGQEMAHA